MKNLLNTVVPQKALIAQPLHVVPAQKPDYQSQSPLVRGIRSRQMFRTYLWNFANSKIQIFRFL